MKKTAVVIVQTSSECNLRCKYCYVRASEDRKIKMSIADVKKLIQNISLDFDRIRFVWHGGEPLLMGIDFYQEVVRVQEEISKNYKIEFRNGIQTNGLLLTDEWLSFFNKNRFSAGISFDAPPEVHAYQRANRTVEAAESDLRAIVEKFEKHNLSLNAICVISKLNVNGGEEIFNFFSDIGAVSYSLLLMMKTPLPECPEAPTNQELTNLYKTTFELWLKGQHNFKSIEPIETMVRSLLGEETPLSCSFASHCLERMITITPEGNVVPCGSFTSSEFILGNILKDPLLKILYNQQCDKFRNQRSAYINENCLNCEFISICRGGCREVAFWHSGEYGGEYPYCEARKETFTYMRKRLQETLIACQR